MRKLFSLSALLSLSIVALALATDWQPSRFERFVVTKSATNIPVSANTVVRVYTQGHSGTLFLNSTSGKRVGGLGFAVYSTSSIVTNDIKVAASVKRLVYMPNYSTGVKYIKVAQ